MIVLLFFAFLAGLTTILAPCIWPLLPIILSSSTTGGHRKPLGITLGIIVSFSIFTLSISYLVMLFHFDPNILRIIAAITIAFLGLTMIVPALLIRYESLITKLSSFIGGRPIASHHGFFGGFITGLSLGIIWSPCAGPILATIAALGATQAVNFQVVLVAIAYGFGVGIPLFLFSFLGTWLFQKSRFISAYTSHVQKLFGVITILTAIAIYTNYDKVIQLKLLSAFPTYTTFTNKLEGNDKVKEQLGILKGEKTKTPGIKKILKSSSLSNYGRAPEFVGISNWIGSKPLTMQELKGKVVLIDFWTYTCINCIRTLPYVTSWYEKYKDKGFMVIGVHTPEFEFEKKTENVENAIKMYNITYPVAQDNNYAIWQAYNNQYWPAKYLIDANGNIRYTHFGEGKYEETEKAIQALLEEAGRKVDGKVVKVEDQTPKTRLTPETYLGKKRGDGSVMFKGSWDILDEQAVASKGSILELRFYANKVFLVVTPATQKDRAKIFLDDKLIGEMVFDVAKLYELVDLKGNIGDHILRIEFEQNGTAVYAFTFG
ncbi:MAG: redoxin domain-containing protein [Candidatus Levyibacteriota bacterium]|nr:MAG: redoxin domain-containing protein [Candidatus Levybacteria bacterium]